MVCDMAQAMFGDVRSCSTATDQLPKLGHPWAASCYVSEAGMNGWPV